MRDAREVDVRDIFRDAISLRIEKDNDTFPTEWYHRFRDIQFQTSRTYQYPLHT